MKKRPISLVLIQLIKRLPVWIRESLSHFRNVPVLCLRPPSFILEAFSFGIIFIGRLHHSICGRFYCLCSLIYEAYKFRRYWYACVSLPKIDSADNRGALYLSCTLEFGTSVRAMRSVREIYK